MVTQQERQHWGRHRNSAHEALKRAREAMAYAKRNADVYAEASAMVPGWNLERFAGKIHTGNPYIMGFA